MRRLIVPTSFAFFLSVVAACTSGSSQPDAGVGGSAGSAGSGGSAGVAADAGPCPEGQEVVQRLVGIEVPCDLQADPGQCGTSCSDHCDEQGYGLGSDGSGCARLPDAGPACRCLCAGCAEL